MRKRTVKTGLAGAIVLGTLALASSALGDTSYSDADGDDNAGPDITGITVAESADGMITITVAARNYQVLPASSWFNLWFDLDHDVTTGNQGDEALLRYLSDGTLTFRLWDGSILVERATAGFTGRYEAGMLTVALPKAALGGVSSFGVLVVSARRQDHGFIASDLAPDHDRSVWVGPAEAAFSDPTRDHDAAPDITSVRVSDAKDGWIRFAISTPNHATVPVESAVVISIDRDNRVTTGDDGAEILVTRIERKDGLQRWSTASREWVAESARTRVRSRNSAGVVAIEVHGSELNNAARFGFSIASVDLNVAAQLIVAADFAPDDRPFWRYALSNPFRIVAGKAFGTPVSPRAGKPFTVSVPVRRSDTGRGISSGSVICNVRAAGKVVPAAGRVRAGRAQCALALVASEAGTRVTGSLTVRSAGASVSASFSFRVR